MSNPEHVSGGEKVVTNTASEERTENVDAFNQKRRDLSKTSDDVGRPAPVGQSVYGARPLTSIHMLAKRVKIEVNHETKPARCTQ